MAINLRTLSKYINKCRPHSLFCNLHLPTETFIICHRFPFPSGLFGCRTSGLHHFSSEGKWKHLILLPELCHKLDSTQLNLAQLSSARLDSTELKPKPKANTLHSGNFNQFILISFEVHINLMDRHPGMGGGAAVGGAPRTSLTYPLAQ